MSRIERVSYRSGFVKRLEEAARVPAITFGTADLPEDVVALAEEAFAAHLTRLPALRKGVVADLKRRLNDSNVLDHPCRGARSRPAPARKRGRKRR